MPDIFSDPDIPLWFKIVNLDEKHFERSKHAGSSVDGKGKFRLKDLGIIRQMAPNIYKAAADEVKEHNDYVFQHGASFKQYKLGKKIGSIPLIDACLHPELASNQKAQEKYWQENPQLKCI